MPRKGIYSIFTTFIFISMAVLVVIGGAYIGSRIALLKSHTGTERFKSSVAESALNELVACHRQEVLDERTIPRCLSNKYVKATRILQPQTSACEAKEWGNNKYFDDAKEQFGTEMTSYWMGVQQYGTGEVCLAQVNFII